MIPALRSLCAALPPDPSAEGHPDQLPVHVSVSYGRTRVKGPPVVHHENLPWHWST
jgi:hypothetical protein